MTEEEALLEAQSIPQAPAAKGTKRKALTKEEALAEATNLPTPRRETSAPEMGLAQGLTRAAIATPGALSSLREWVSSLPAHTPQGQWLKENVSVPPIPGIQQALTGPTSQELLDMFDKNVMPFLHTTGPAAVTERIGEMYMPGSGGKAQAARDAFTAIGAGVGSKAGEELAKGMGASETGQSWSDFIGSMLGIAASRGRKANPIKIAGENAPTQQQLETSTKQAYDAVKPVELDRPAFVQAVDDINAQVKKRHAPGLIKDLNKLSTANTPLTFDQVNKLAKEANENANYSGKKPSRSNAHRYIADRLDEYFEVAAPTNPAFTQQLAQATELGRAQAVTRDLRTAQYKGRNYREGPEVGREKRVKTLADKRPGRFTDIEEKALHEAVGGNTARDAMKLLKKWPVYIASAAAPALAFSGLGGLSLASMGTALGAAGVGAVGEKILNRQSRKRLDDFAAAVRAGRPAQKGAATTASKRDAQRRQAYVKGILGSLRANEMNRGQQ